MKVSIILILVFISTISNGQNFSDRDTLGPIFAKNFVSRFPNADDSTRYFYKNTRHKHLCLLADSSTVLKVAMPILTKAYGKVEIDKWKPFEIYFISNYWFISGTNKKRQLPKGVTVTGGDPFIMVIDGYNSKVIYMMAGE
jgi:hypothetical protein